MVDEFASVWPIVALEGVGDLIGDARPGLVASAAGRRLAFANAAAAALFAAPPVWGEPLAVDRRLADRIARFARRAAPGEEARELLRFTEAGRPTLRTVVFRRPIDTDDAVIAIVDGGRADPDAAASVAAGIAPFAADGGLAALFDADGAVLGAVGDLDLAEGAVEAVETALAEADEIAVLERTLVSDGALHDLVLVRLGDRPDARRLLRLGPARPIETAPTPVDAPAAPRDAAPLATVTTDDLEAPAPATDTAAPSEPPARLATPVAPTPASAPVDTAEDLDEDRFVAAPPLPLDLFDDLDTGDEPLHRAWADEAVGERGETAPEAAAETTPAEDTDAEADAPRPAEEPSGPAEASRAGEETADAVAPTADRLPLAALAEALPLAARADDETTTEEETEAGLPKPTALAAQIVAPSPAADVAPELAPGFRFTPLDRPLKFVWQMDADRRFTLVSEEFAGVVGPAAADLLGRRWDEVVARLDVDHDGAIAEALSRHDTWSGRSVLWPIEGTALRLPVDLAALPAFDRGRTFVGFRGFGTCRADAPVADPRATGLRLAAAPSPQIAAPVAAVDRVAEAPAPEVVPDETPEAGSDATVVPTDAIAPEVAPTDAAPSEPVPTDAVDVDEARAEPPLFPDDDESATDEADHPVEAAFAGDLGDDPLVRFAEPAAAVETPLETNAPTPTEDDATPAEPVSEPEPPAAEPAAARAAPRLVALSDGARATEETTRLSVPERHAFRQIAEALGARIEGEADLPPPAPAPRAEPAPRRLASAPTPRVAPVALDARLLDRLPLALALLRDDTLVHANERFLSLLRYPDLAALRAAGGLDALFAGPHAARRFETGDGRPMPLLARDGTVVPCDATIATVPVEGGSAVLLLLGEHDTARPAAAEPQGSAADRERIGELQAIVDTATDGVLMLDASGLVLSANAAAEALFGVERRAMIGRPLTDRLAPESRRSAMDYLDGLASNGVASVLNDGREVIGVVAPEGLTPLFMTIGRVSTGPIAKYCAVLRDITQWKKSEEELTTARRRAEEASIHKSDFLAKISHEIRTPLNAIIGFSELMLDERFGPIGNERYKDYLRDIHVSGSHIMSLVNDLLDLSKVEAGKMDLRFEAVPLAEVVSECVALMQPQANRERIIIRSSLPAGVPPVVADPRSMRQVVLNLLSNAVKFTPAGGQVIVSITLEDNGEVVLRVRDTGYGMSEKELQTAMEPFRQLHTTGSRAGGTGLGLPLTKALAEANRAAFRIDSTVGQGTLVSIAFPVTRVLAG